MVPNHRPSNLTPPYHFIPTSLSKLSDVEFLQILCIGWLCTDGVMGTVIDDDVFVIGKILMAYRRHIPHMHQKSTVSIKAEYLKGKRWKFQTGFGGAVVRAACI